MLALWTALCKALDQLAWKGRIVVCNCLAEFLDNASASIGTRPALASEVASSFTPLVTPLVAVVEENKQVSLRLAALRAVTNLAALMPTLKPTDGAVVERLHVVAQSCASDPDVQLAATAVKLKTALSSS